MKSTHFCLIPFLASLLATSPILAQQPDTSKPDVKEKVTLHITREEDGKTVVYDTTFENQGYFNVDEFLKQKGFDEFSNKMSPKNFQHEFDFRSPELDMGFFDFKLDSLLQGADMLGDNFRIFRNAPGSYHFEWKNLPDTKFDFNAPDDSELRYGHPLPPSLLMPPQEKFMPGLLPGRLDKLLEGQQIEKMVVKNKRYGKKIVIKTKKHPNRFSNIGNEWPYSRNDSFYYPAPPYAPKHGKSHHKRISNKKHSQSPGDTEKKEERKVIIVRP